jgi:hypothetical protein
VAENILLSVGDGKGGCRGSSRGCDRAPNTYRVGGGKDREMAYKKCIFHIIMEI